MFWGLLKKKADYSRLILYVFLVLGITGVLLGSNDPVSQRFYSSFDFDDGSVSGRLEIWDDALNVWFDNFWTGWV